MKLEGWKANVVLIGAILHIAGVVLSLAILVLAGFVH